MSSTSDLIVFDHFVSVTGPCHPDGPRVHYPPNMYVGPPCEPPMPSHGWHYPVRPANHIDMAPHRPYPEAPVPMAARGAPFS